MSQIEKNPKNEGRFSSGLLLGMVLGGVGLYFMGTKNGRKQVKKALDYAENFEEILADYEKSEGRKKNVVKNIVSDVENVLDKIKHVLPENSKFFKK